MRRYAKYAATCDFQHCDILTSLDSEEPVCAASFYVMPSIVIDDVMEIKLANEDVMLARAQSVQ